MKTLLWRLGQRLAPRTTTNLRRLNALDPEFDSSMPRLITYERELRELRREIDEMRRDNRRVAELYDVFFEWAHKSAAVRPSTSSRDAAATVDRVAELLSMESQDPSTRS